MRAASSVPQTILAAAVLALIAFAAYAPALRGGFVWDDDRYIEGNVQLRSVDGLERIWKQVVPIVEYAQANHRGDAPQKLDQLWLHATIEPQYYPLTHSSFWLEYHLWGDAAFGYHLDNLLLHICSGLLLWRLLKGLQVPGAYAAALLFVVHPVQTESVAWATERKNVLSGLLYLLSLWAYLNFLRISPSPGTPGEGRGEGKSKWYVIALLLFFCALLSKSVTATLPAVVLLILWWKRGTLRWSDLWPLLPMFAVALAMGTLTGWMEKHVVGAIGPIYDRLTPLDRLCIAGRAIWFYLAKLLWPMKLTFIYPRWDISAALHPWQLLFPVAAISALVGLYLLRGKISRGPLTAMLFFVGTLVPALGFVNVFPMRFSFVADHFQYLACIGPLTLIAAMLSRLPRGANIALVTLIVVTLCTLSDLQSRIYHDRATLWQDTLAKNPDSSMAHNNYAIVLKDDGDLDTAQAQFTHAMELANDPTQHIGIGQCCYMRGDFAGALRNYREAAEAMTDSPERVLHQFLTIPYFQMGTAYTALAGQSQNDPAQAAAYRQQAIAAYRRAIEFYPFNEDAMINLADILLSEKDYAGSIELCHKVLEIDPDSISALTHLGNALLAQGQLDEAMKQYVKVLHVQPLNANAFNNIGIIWAEKGQYDLAIAQFQEALRIDPQFEKAHNNLLAAMDKKLRSAP